MFLRCVCCLLALALGGSFLGALHGVGDSLAVFRLALAALLFGAALLCSWPWRVRFALMVCAATGVGSIGEHTLAEPAAGPVGIYQKNMFYQNSAREDLVRDILAADVDFVTLQEVSEDNEIILTALQDQFPHQHLCRYSRSSGLAVLSRVPGAGTPVCVRGVGMAALPVRIDGQVVTIMSVHLTWPYPKPQAAQVDRLEKLLARTEGPMIIGGDFNMVPWSDTLRSVTRASGTRQTGPSDDSFSLFGLPLPIDHVLAPGGGRKEMRPELGSDHRGVVARVHIEEPGDSVENPN